MSSNITETPEMQIVYEHPRPTPAHMTFEEFLAWDHEGHLAEWVGGEVRLMAPAATRHQRVGSFLEKVLGFYVEMHNLGEVFRAPFVMRVSDSSHGCEPDLLIVSRERAHLVESAYLNGAADMVVEIVSPESIGRDRGEKFVEYEQAGIKEYWLIDPDRQTAEFYELGADNRYRAAQTEPDGIYRSQVVSGFFVRASWLWQTPSPTLDALSELKLI